MAEENQSVPAPTPSVYPEDPGDTSKGQPPELRTVSGPGEGPSLPKVKWEPPAETGQTGQ